MADLNDLWTQLRNQMQPGSDDSQPQDSNNAPAQPSTPDYSGIQKNVQSDLVKEQADQQKGYAAAAAQAQKQYTQSLKDQGMTVTHDATGNPTPAQAPNGGLLRRKFGSNFSVDDKEGKIWQPDLQNGGYQEVTNKTTSKNGHIVDAVGRTVGVNPDVQTLEDAHTALNTNDGELKTEDHPAVVKANKDYQTAVNAHLSMQKPGAVMDDGTKEGRPITQDDLDAAKQKIADAQAKVATAKDYRNRKVANDVLLHQITQDKRDVANGKQIPPERMAAYQNVLTNRAIKDQGPDDTNDTGTEQPATASPTAPAQATPAAPATPAQPNAALTGENDPGYQAEVAQINQQFGNEGPTKQGAVNSARQRYGLPPLSAPSPAAAAPQAPPTTPAATPQQQAADSSIDPNTPAPSPAPPAPQPMPPQIAKPAADPAKGRLATVDDVTGIPPADGKALLDESAATIQARAANLQQKQQAIAQPVQEAQASLNQFWSVNNASVSNGDPTAQKFYKDGTPITGPNGEPVAAHLWDKLTGTYDAYNKAIGNFQKNQAVIQPDIDSLNAAQAEHSNALAAFNNQIGADNEAARVKQQADLSAQQDQLQTGLRQQGHSDVADKLKDLGATRDSLMGDLEERLSSAGVSPDSDEAQAARRSIDQEMSQRQHETMKPVILPGVAQKIYAAQADAADKKKAEEQNPSNFTGENAYQNPGDPDFQKYLKDTYDAPVDAKVQSALKHYGVTEDDVKPYLEDMAKQDFGRNGKESNVLKDGSVAVNPKNYFRPDQYKAAVDASGGTDEQKRAAMAKFPALQNAASLNLYNELTKADPTIKKEIDAMPVDRDINEDSSWGAMQRERSQAAQEAGLPNVGSGYNQLRDAIQRTQAAGYPVQHFIGTTAEQEGDRAPSMDQQNLIDALTKQKADAEAGGDAATADKVAKEIAFWKADLDKNGMSAAQWKKQTGEADPAYPATPAQELDPRAQKMAAYMNQGYLDRALDQMKASVRQNVYSTAKAGTGILAAMASSVDAGYRALGLNSLGNGEAANALHQQAIDFNQRSQDNARLEGLLNTGGIVGNVTSGVNKAIGMVPDLALMAGAGGIAKTARFLTNPAMRSAFGGADAAMAEMRAAAATGDVAGMGGAYRNYLKAQGVNEADMGETLMKLSDKFKESGGQVLPGDLIGALADIGDSKVANLIKQQNATGANAAAAYFSGKSGGDTYVDAYQKNLADIDKQGGMSDAEKQQAASAKSILPAILNAAATYGIFRNKPLGGITNSEPETRAMLEKSLWDVAKGVGSQSAADAGKMGLDTLAHSIVAKASYDPQRPVGQIIDDVLSSAMTGGLLGGFTRLVHEAALKTSKGRGTVPSPPESQNPESGNGEPPVPELGPSTLGPSAPEGGESAESEPSADVLPPESAPAVAPEDREAISRTAMQRASDTELAKMGDTDPVGAQRGDVLRRIASGEDMTKMPVADLQAIGMDRNASGGIVPLKAKDSTPDVYMVKGSDGGMKPVIKDSVLQQLKEEAPATHSLIPMGEREALAKATAEKPPDEPKPATPFKKPAKVKAAPATEAGVKAGFKEKNPAEILAKQFPQKIIGYHNKGTTEAIAYDKNGGWKLHLGVDPNKAQAVHDWLQANTKSGYKILSGGDAGEGNDFTVYVGSKDAAEALADKIHSKIGKILQDKTAGKVSSGDAVWNPKVSARFDVRGGRSSGPSPKEAPWIHYGENGIPLDDEGASKAQWGTTPEERAAIRQQETQRVHRELTAKYGDFYTGTKGKESAPSASPSDTLKQWGRENLRDENKGTVKQFGLLKLATEAMKPYENAFPGVDITENAGSALMLHPSTGRLGINPEALLGALHDAKTVKHASDFIKSALSEEYIHRITTGLEASDPEFSKTLRELWDKLPASLKTQSGSAYNKKPGAEHANDFTGRHEFLRQYIQAGVEGKQLTEATLREAGLLGHLRKIIAALYRELRKLAKGVKHPELKALLDKLVERFKAEDERLRGGKEQEEAPKPTKEELRKTAIAEAKTKDGNKSSTQLTMTPEQAKPFTDFAKSIPDSELYSAIDPKWSDDARETEPHITTLFGLHDPDSEKASKIIAKTGPITVTLGKTSIFENPDYDVLKVEASGKELHALNARLSKLPNGNTFPDYKPHVTIAYLKKGEGAKYAGDTRFEGQQITFPTLTYSPPPKLREAFGRPELPFAPTAEGEETPEKEQVAPPIREEPFQRPNAPDESDQPREDKNPVSTNLGLLKGSGTSKQVRDHTQIAKIGSGRIWITHKVGNKSAGGFSFLLQEWIDAEKHPNPNYSRREVIKKYTANLDEQDGGPAQADRIKDAIVDAIKKAMTGAGADSAKIYQQQKATKSPPITPAANEPSDQRPATPEQPGPQGNEVAQDAGLNEPAPTGGKLQTPLEPEEGKGEDVAKPETVTSPAPEAPADIPSESRESKSESGIQGAEGQTAVSSGAVPKAEIAPEQATAPAKPKKLTPKNTFEALKKYFTPGAIVESYGGQDRVISFHGADMGKWHVKVQAVDKEGNDKPGEHPRGHMTQPSRKNLEKALNEPEPLGTPGVAITPEQDKAYLDAVAKGDTETAQRMVDEAAKKAGYDVGPVFHGTNKKGLTEFFGGWWSDNKKTTREFGNERYSAYLKGPFADGDDLRKLYRKFNGTDIDPDSDELLYDHEIADMAMSGGPFNREVERSGYRGISVWDESNAETGMAYAAFAPSQIKSADPITRDADGKVIPLSERFNPDRKDILHAPGSANRFSDENLGDYEPTEAELAEFRKFHEADEKGSPKYVPGTTIPEMPAGSVGIRNKFTDWQRKMRGLPPRMKTAARGFGLLWDEAMQAINDDPGIGADLVNRINSDPQTPISDTQVAILHHEYLVRSQEQDNAARAVNEAPNELARLQAMERLERARKSYKEGLDADDLAGKSSARAQNARRMAIKEDFSLAKLEYNQRAGYGGKWPSKEVEKRDLAEISRLHAAMDAKQDQIDKLEAEKAKMYSKAQVKKMVDEARGNPKTVIKYRTRKPVVEESYEDKRTRMLDQLKELGLSAPGSAEGLEASKPESKNAILTGLGEAHYGLGAKDFDDWEAAMHADSVKDLMGKNAQEIFEKSKAAYDKAFSEGLRKKARSQKPEGVLDAMKANYEDDGLIDPAGVRAIAMAHIKAGETDPEEVLRKTHESLKQIDPEITEGEVSDAISGRGNPPEATEDPYQKILNETKTQLALLQNIEALEKGEAALRRGRPAEPRSEAVRSLSARLYDLMKASGQETTDPATQLKTALDKLRASLTNRRDDLKKQVDAEKRTPRNVDPVKRTADLEKLEKEIKDLNAQLDEIDPKVIKEKTPEQIIRNMKRALNRTIGANKRNIASMEKTGKEIPKKPKREIAIDDELRKLTYERDVTRGQIVAMRKEAELSQRPAFKKALDELSHFFTNMAIGGYHTGVKLAGYDVGKVAELTVGEAIGRLMSIPYTPFAGLMRKADMEGNGGLGKFFVSMPRGLKEAWQQLVTGDSPTRKLNDPTAEAPTRWHDWIGGNLHAAEKAFLLVASEALHFEKLRSQALRDGRKFDEVEGHKEAYEYAKRDALMEKNKVANWISSGIESWGRKDPKTGKTPFWGNILKTATEILLTKRILHVPMNFVAQTAERSPLGLATGLVRAAHAARPGAEPLTPKESQFIARLIKFGLMGSAFFAYGMFDASRKKKDRTLGGYYQPGDKRDPDDVLADGIRINGYTLPRWIAHSPLIELAQMGSTLMRVAAHRASKKAEPAGYLRAAVASSLGLLRKAPVIGTIPKLEDLGNPQKEVHVWNEMVSGLVPALSANLAEDTDRKTPEGKPSTNPLDEAVSRKAETTLDAVKTKIPGARQQVQERYTRPVSKLQQQIQDYNDTVSDPKKQLHMADVSQGTLNKFDTPQNQYKFESRFAELEDQKAKTGPTKFKTEGKIKTPIVGSPITPDEIAHPTPITEGKINAVRKSAYDQAKEEMKSALIEQPKPKIKPVKVKIPGS